MKEEYPPTSVIDNNTELVGYKALATESSSEESNMLFPHKDYHMGIPQTPGGSNSEQFTLDIAAVTLQYTWTSISYAVYFFQHFVAYLPSAQNHAYS